MVWRWAYPYQNRAATALQKCRQSLWGELRVRATTARQGRFARPRGLEPPAMDLHVMFRNPSPQITIGGPLHLPCVSLPPRLSHSRAVLRSEPSVSLMPRSRATEASLRSDPHHRHHHMCPAAKRAFKEKLADRLVPAASWVARSSPHGRLGEHQVLVFSLPSAIEWQKSTQETRKSRLLGLFKKHWVPAAGRGPGAGWGATHSYHGRAASGAIT